MKIEAGKFYRTRDGRKARVYAVDGWGDHSIHGAYLFQGRWVNCVWQECGLHGMKEGNGDPYDLIAEWVDKPVVDWSKMAAWHRWVAMNENGWWFAFTLKPMLGKVSWVEDQCLGCGHPQFIHPDYSPAFSGNWKDSLVERPTE